MSQWNFDRLLQKYLAGECTSAEEKLVLEWYETLIRDSDLHLLETERSLIEGRLWNAIQTNVQSPSATALPARVIRVSARTWFRVTAAAAVLTVIATAIILSRQRTGNNIPPATVAIQTGYDSLVNSTNTTKQLLLTDSTLVTLQPGAVVYYPPFFTAGTREIYLQGSAFFNVYHDPKKHFKVHLNDGLTTEVLGTSFQITQSKTSSNIEVAVVTGKVLVYQQHNTNEDTTGSVVLTRNKKATFNSVSNRLITGIVDDPQPLPKTKTQQGTGSKPPGDRLVFEEALLQEVLQSLSEVYGIIIIPENEQLGRVHFTGNLSTFSLFNQLNYICKTTQTKYEINGSQIIIKENQQ